MSSAPSPFGTPESRAEHAHLQSQLEERASTQHFAHTGVSMMGAIIMGGASGKLFWDAKHFPWLALIATVVCLVLLVYSVVQYVRGRRTLARELVLFDSLKSVRRILRMDDPSALLPQ